MPKIRSIQHRLACQTGLWHDVKNAEAAIHELMWQWRCAEIHNLERKAFLQQVHVIDPVLLQSACMISDLNMTWRPPGLAWSTISCFHSAQLHLQHPDLMIPASHAIRRLWFTHVSNTIPDMPQNMLKVCILSVTTWRRLIFWTACICDWDHTLSSAYCITIWEYIALIIAAYIHQFTWYTGHTGI